MYLCITSIYITYLLVEGSVLEGSVLEGVGSWDERSMIVKWIDRIKDNACSRDTSHFDLIADLPASKNNSRLGDRERNRKREILLISMATFAF